MTLQALLELLNEVLDGHAAPESLLAALDAPGSVAPDAAAALLRQLEDRYASGTVHFELYLPLKDRLQVLARPRSTRPPAWRTSSTTSPPSAPVTDPAAPAGSDRTRLRMPTVPPADRTQLRPPTSPPPDRTQLRGAMPPAETVYAGTRPAEPSPPVQRSRPPSWPTAPRGAQGADESPEVRTWVIEAPLEPGTVIKERFVLDQRLGEGGMGVVFKARDLRKEEARDRDPYVAIKFLSSEFRRHPEAFMALQRESRRAQALAHPNVVTVHDFDRDGTLIYMTMEFLEGEPLDRFIQRHPQGLRFKEAWSIIEGCARALAYAHEEGVVHADFKPGNVFVSGKRKVKVLDFGIARAVTRRGDDSVTGTRFDAGSLGALTPAYASPEMLLNDKPDPRDDVYALACVSYELLTGRHPFDGQPAVKAAHDGMQVRRLAGMGRRQHRALAHGLAFKQADRTPSIEAFLDELAGPLGARGRALRQSLLSVAATGVIVAGLAAGAWWLSRTDPDDQLRQQLVESARAQAEESLRRSGQSPELDPELRDVLLEQGRDYITLATGSKFDPILLSEGVSSAYGAFINALRMDPSSTEALDGLVEIVRIYEREAARALEGGDAARAAELAGYGLKIQPGRESLIELRSSAETSLDQSSP
jgi:serine/threonine protein kinase